MFDKNDFYEKFRQWTELHPSASAEEARLLCDLLIPIEAKKQYNWLEEQSLAWFLWKKENHAKQKLSLLFLLNTEENESEDNYIDKQKII